MPSIKNIKQTEPKTTIIIILALGFLILAGYVGWTAYQKHAIKRNQVFIQQGANTILNHLLGKTEIITNGSCPTSAFNIPDKDNKLVTYEFVRADCVRNLLNKPVDTPVPELIPEPAPMPEPEEVNE